MKQTRKILVFILIIALVGSIFPQLLYLKDGSVVKGQIKTITNYIVSVSTLFGSVSILRSDVNYIAFDENAAKKDGITIRTDKDSSVTFSGSISKYDTNSGLIEFDNGTYAFSTPQAIEIACFSTPTINMQKVDLPSVLPYKEKKMTVEMTSGEKFKGDFVSRTSDKVTFNVDYGIISIFEGYIKNIYFPEDSSFNAIINHKSGAKIYGEILKYGGSTFVVRTPVGITSYVQSDITSIDMIDEQNH